MLNERLDPEEVEEIMVRIKATATAIVERHGGIVNQFVGDEIYSVFGVPQARRDDPQRAVRAALELHRAVEEISAQVASKIGQPLAMHSGINTGPVMIEKIGKDNQARDMVMGETVRQELTGVGGNIGGQVNSSRCKAK